MTEKIFYVYILTNYTNTVIYVGITNNLIRRVWEHKNSVIKGFTSKYKINKLVYFETFHTSYEAISREKQLKGGSRKKKVELVEGSNPTWGDLYAELIG